MTWHTSITWRLILAACCVAQETGGNDVSRKTKKGYKSGYSKTKREIEQGKIRDVGQFIALAQGRAGIQPHSRPASDSELQALAPKARGRRKKAMGEFCKWTAMPREQQAMLEMFCRKGDVRELLVSACAPPTFPAACPANAPPRCASTRLITAAFGGELARALGQRLKPSAGVARLVRVLCVFAVVQLFVTPVLSKFSNFKSRVRHLGLKLNLPP